MKNTRRNLVTAGAIAAVAAFGAVGCGSSDDETTAADAAVSTDAAITDKSANSYFNTAIDAIGENLGPLYGAIDSAKTPEELSAALTALAAGQRAAADAVDALEPSADAQEYVDAVSAGARDFADGLDAEAKIDGITLDQVKADLKDESDGLDTALKALKDSGL